MITNDDNARIGHNIAICREFRDRSVTWLADSISSPDHRIKRLSMDRMEKNTQVIPAYIVPMVADALEVPYQLLMGDRLSKDTVAQEVSQYSQKQLRIRELRESLIAMAYKLDTNGHFELCSEEKAGSSG